MRLTRTDLCGLYWSRFTTAATGLYRAAGARPPAAAEERVAPAVDAVAVDVRHRADAAQVKVAGDEGDGERPAGFELGVLRLLGDGGRRPAASDRHGPGVAEGVAEQAEAVRRE